MEVHCFGLLEDLDRNTDVEGIDADTVVAAFERNPELGREFKHPAARRSFAAELAGWERAL